MRTCRVCGLEKPLDDLVKDKKAKDGRKRLCKVCDAERMRNYFKSNPDKYENNKRIARDSRPNWKRHGIDQSVYDEMLGRYDGKCWSCQSEQGTHIDHNHNCCDSARGCNLCIRGILCNGCNAALGHLKDDLDRINGLMVYLTSRSREVRSISPPS